jgi:hypothetical protein
MSCNITCKFLVYIRMDDTHFKSMLISIQLLSSASLDSCRPASKVADGS